MAVYEFSSKCETGRPATDDADVGFQRPGWRNFGPVNMHQLSKVKLQSGNEVYAEEQET
jgi:hypothetical protein